MGGDAVEILNRAIPDRREVNGAYLVYLSQTRRLAAIPAVARRIRDAADFPLLYGACDQLLAARDPAALDLWLMTGQPAPSGIFNGDFAAMPLNHGFDWRLIESRGVTHVHLNTPAGHRIAFNGQQAEECSLLEQTLMLGTGKRYRLRWEARTAGMKSPSGLEWGVAGLTTPLLQSADWAPGEMIFTVPEVFERLELAYRRPLGESRTEGNVELRRVLIEAVP
jgi:hypothetical protein